jgi:predicted Zn-dependent peptidase
VRVDQRAIVTNPLDSAADYDSISAEVIIDRPDYGFTVTQVDQLLAALKAQLTTAFVTKLYGNES